MAGRDGLRGEEEEEEEKRGQHCTGVRWRRWSWQQRWRNNKMRNLRGKPVILNSVMKVKGNGSKKERPREKQRVPRPVDLRRWRSPRAQVTGVF